MQNGQNSIIFLSNSIKCEILIKPVKSIKTTAIMLVTAAMKNTFPGTDLVNAKIYRFSSVNPAYPLDGK